MPDVALAKREEEAHSFRGNELDCRARDVESTRVLEGEHVVDGNEVRRYVECAVNGGAHQRGRRRDDAASRGPLRRERSRDERTNSRHDHYERPTHAKTLTYAFGPCQFEIVGDRGLRDRARP